MEDSMAEKFDWKKKYKDLYFPNSEVCEVLVPAMNYLMINGAGDPNSSPEFQTAVEALYTLSYTIKFNIKNSGGTEYSVFPLEGLWWAPDMKAFSEDNNDKSSWLWTLMIAQPDFVKTEHVEECRKAAIEKKGFPKLKDVRFETYNEGNAAQLMHVGPYSAEGPNILRIHKWIKDNGYVIDKKHHEIYISDMRRTAPEKLKTVVRQPFK